MRDCLRTHSGTCQVSQSQTAFLPSQEPMIATIFTSMCLSCPASRVFKQRVCKLNLQGFSLRSVCQSPNSLCQSARQREPVPLIVNVKACAALASCTRWEAGRACSDMGSFAPAQRLGDCQGAKGGRLAMKLLQRQLQSVCPAASLGLSSR